ncbi:hypothetical protein ACLQ28_11145 [Micromonospora sp. DT201]|uniref:hypothetical protein n=1 Tax=Micromonospora sp. DT201 TaxID=3393442 RepID=UPI003CE94105
MPPWHGGPGGGCGYRTPAVTPAVGPACGLRGELRTHSPEWNPPTSWHLAALTAAGFTQVGTVWQGGPDAIAAVR